MVENRDAADPAQLARDLLQRGSNPARLDRLLDDLEDPSLFRGVGGHQSRAAST